MHSPRMFISVKISNNLFSNKPSLGWMQFLLEEVMFQNKACVLGKKVVLTTMTIIGVFPSKCLHSFFFFAKNSSTKSSHSFHVFVIVPISHNCVPLGFPLLGYFQHCMCFSCHCSPVLSSHGH